MTDVLALLSDQTGLSDRDLARIVQTAPSRYKVFEIPKRSGGMREIAQPARELKFIQRILVRAILAELPIHTAAHAYRKGMSIKDNAAIHAGHGPILKMDFANFFPSILATDWLSYCRANAILDRQNAEVTARLLFRRKRGERLLKLSIGAPSSPVLSNILLYKFDELVSAEASKRGIRYTRYADDMSFSGQRIGMLRDMLAIVPAAARQVRRPRLKVNAEKTTFVTASTRRMVTGVTLSNDGTVGLGHDRKRLIRAKVHHAALGKLSQEELFALAGELAFVNVVERNFLDRLRARYGDAAIDQIRKSVSL